MKPGRIVLLVIGVILVLTSCGLIIGGGVILTIENAFKDSQGFYSTSKTELEAKSAAIVTGTASFEMGTVRPNSPGLVTLKIEAGNLNPDKPIFIGIARTSAINSYLDGISYSEISDAGDHRNPLLLRTYKGADSAPAPVSQGFWVAAVNGTGTQTLEWEIMSGRYSAVLMNADGSSPVEAEVSLGIKIPGVVKAIGIGLLVSGIILFLGSGVMLFFGVKDW